MGQLINFAGAPVSGVNEVQRITPGGTISGGTWTITYSGQTTAAIAYNATAAQVQAALEALSNVEPGDIVVSGGPLTSAFFVLTFARFLGGLNVAQVTVSAASLTGSLPTLTPSTTTAGVQGTARGTAVGSQLMDTTSGILYISSGSSWAPVWTASSGIPTQAPYVDRTRTDTPDTAYNDVTQPPKSNDYTFSPVIT